MRSALTLGAIIVAGLVLARFARAQTPTPAPSSTAAGLALTNSPDHITQGRYGATSSGQWIDGYFGPIWVPSS